MVEKWRFSWVRCVVVALALLGLTVSAGRAAVILVIDITDPANVTFTATGAHAENDDPDTWLMYGFTLTGFFDSSVEDWDIHYFDESDLYSPEGNFEYTDFTSIDFSGGSNYVDLNIFGSGFSEQGFSTTAPAFTGSAVADLRGWIAQIMGGGTVGSIYTDSEEQYGILIGEYQIVPEPTTMMAVLLGLGVMGMWQRRRVVA